MIYTARNGDLVKKDSVSILNELIIGVGIHNAGPFCIRFDIIDVDIEPDAHAVPSIGRGRNLETYSVLVVIISRPILLN